MHRSPIVRKVHGTALNAQGCTTCLRVLELDVPNRSRK